MLLGVFQPAINVLFPVAIFSGCNKAFIGFVAEGCGGVSVLAKLLARVLSIGPMAKAIFFSGILSAAVTTLTPGVFSGPVCFKLIEMVLLPVAFNAVTVVPLTRLVAANDPEKDARRLCTRCCWTCADASLVPKNGIAIKDIPKIVTVKVAAIDISLPRMYRMYISILRAVPICISELEYTCSQPLMRI
jgi:hypothetical protein